MEKKKLVVRTDASSSIGSGHIMRCLVAAKEFQKQNYDVIFVTNGDIGLALEELIQKSKMELRKLPKAEKDSLVIWNDFFIEKDLQLFLDAIHDIKAHIIIVDHYKLNKIWEEKAKLFTNCLFVIDDLANREHRCNYLLDQNYYYNKPESRYNSLININCKLLLGPKYSLLREEFYKLRATSSTRLRGVPLKKILVFFGGSDPTNETSKVVDALLNHKIKFDVDVVIGGANKNYFNIVAQYKFYPNVKIYYNISNVAQIMSQNDISIGAGGTTTWERCILGLPSIIICIAENQIGISSEIDQHGAAINLGWHKDVGTKDIIRCLDELILTPQKIEIMSSKSLELMKESFGAKTVVQELLKGEGTIWKSV
ncbi:UDP-2,4-diacetamido-2,4,6-trideoxy-beta-L-altropyranose hydrolase [Paenibacillus thalictri]|uniref:UDP-2,4-diacetamido-2,4, 6-trideoxy-beta-L-altropyranose hydrolase n=1 Tax=Paenibacillus thalictri TaxID=2527873 RepID=A0A4Q9DFN7_9BACL|nr:UDP-2,4-diacetamido-2,4,6-trideoxy-beta-L-altropyranose hydrolase [Paenibacillus thalictri]TBL67776.1 UDP-2,4-diacetamido-2,4,6-trideoxy-beta-L-altropyranose hydrolase [Paenibacillus thalictri]